MPLLVKAQTASFSISLSSHCGNGTATFTDTSTETVTKWEWNFGNSNYLTTTDPAQGKTPSANYPGPGVYTVTLSVNDGPVTSQTITIYPNPEPDFSPSVVSGCEPMDVVLTATANDVNVAPYDIDGTPIGGVSAGAITSYQWDFQGKIPGVTENDPVLSLPDLGANEYGVLLLVSDEYGCEGTIYEPAVFSVNATPSGDFSITKQNSCGLGDVALEATATISNGNISEYQWDINNDGSIEAKSQAYTHTFSSTGTFDISLTLQSDAGCLSSELIKQIQFNDGNSSDFTYSGSCVGQNVSFTDASSASAVAWSWDFNNDDIEDSNLKNPSTTFETTGDHEVSVTVTHSDGCEMEVIKTITITGVTPSFTYEATSACPPDYNVTFTDASTTTIGSVVSWSWDFNGDGIEDSNIKNPDYNFTSAGSHRVKLTVTTDGGCSVEFTDFVMVEEKTLDFTVSAPTNGCEGLVVGFSGVYSDATNDPVTNWDWTFENGSAAGTGQNPSHTYNSRGEYSVGLTVTTTNGCSLTKTETNIIRVGEKPILSNVTYPSSDCKQSAVQFTATFTGLADSLYWNFSNGSNHALNFSDGISPQIVNHNFTDDGSHSLTVVAYDNGCPSDPFTLNNIIINQPVARFTIDKNVHCSVPATVNFTNISDSDAAGTVYTWDFGDGVTLETVSPSHTYNDPGDYVVSLTVFNPETGCTDEITKNVYVTSSNPEFITDKTVDCHPAEISFTNQIAANSSANFSISSVAWDFDNNGSIESSDLNPSYTYASPDAYDVKLTVTEQRGCKYSVVKTGFLSINGPVASFSKDPVEACLNQEITFTNTTSQHDGDPADYSKNTYEWNFGDGSASALENPTHTYTSENNFRVSLKVSDENACSNTVSENNSVIVPNLTAGFETEEEIYCAGEIVTFDNTASIVNGTATITQYEWDLDGDGIYEISTSSSSNQTFVFSSAGTFTIKQRVTSSLGCPDEISKEITIVDGDGSFIADETILGCAPAGTTFRAKDNDSMVSSYHWDFGDGETATSREALHFYVEPGSYNVTLTVTLTGGCVKTSTQTVKVAGPVGNFSYDNLNGCADPNHEVTFEAANMKDVTELTWDYGIGVTRKESVAAGTASKSITYNYTAAGTKLPILILTDDGTCGSFSYIREDLGRINTSTPPLVDFSKSSGDNICENVEFQFSDLSTLTDNRYQIDSWSWDFDEDGVEDSNLQHPKYTYATAGTYDVSLTVTTSFGCTATLTKPDFVSVVSPNNLTNVLISTTEASVQNNKVCPGEAVIYNGSASSTNGDGSIFSYHWDFGDGLESNSQSQTHTFNSLDAGSTATITLTVTDNSQCVKSTTVDFSIYKVEADFLITSSPVLRGNTIDFADRSTSKIGGANDGVIDTWYWTFEQGTPDNANTQNPTITYNTIGNEFEVNLAVQNSEGCADNIIKTVNVLNNPPVVSDFTVSGDEDTDILIGQTNFDSHYDTSLDPMQTPLVKVKILSLPDHGDLYNGSVKITSTDIEVVYADLPNLKFKPDENWNGETTFDYNAYDGYDYAVADATITISVNQVEDAPVITSFSDSQNKDVNYSIQLSDFVNHFSDVDYDVDNDGLADVPANLYPDFQKMKVTILPSAAMGVLKLNGSAITADQEITKTELTSHDLIFEPADGYVGDAIFTWNASDGAEYAAIPATVTINYFNTKCILTDENLGNSIQEDAVVSIKQADFTNNHSDSDVNDDPFDKIKIVSFVSNGGSFEFNSGALIVNQEIDYADLINDITFTPATPVGGYNGTISLEWDAFDGTEWSTGSATFSFTYVNTKPFSGTVNKAAIDEDTQASFTFSDFDDQFTDDDAHDVLTYVKIKRLPLNGDLELDGNPVADEQNIPSADISKLVYIPDANYNGTDNFKWRGNDGSSNSNANGTVNLTINPIQDKPVVADINKTAVEDNDVQITRANFEAKFSDVDKPYTEPKNDDLEEITIVNLPSNGTLLHNGVPVAIGTNNIIAVANIDNGTGLVFDPDPGYEGHSSFQWNGSDGAEYADANATVTITHNNTKPVVSDFDKGDQLEDVVITFTRLDFENHYSDANATDSQFEKINIISLPTASIGKFTLDGVDLTIGEYTYAALLNGLVFTPNAGANGIVNLVWNGFDGTEYASSNATFSFTYINSAPTVSDFSKAAVNEDNDVVFATTDFTDALLGNYADVDVNDIFGKIKVTDTPDHGSLKYGSTTVTSGAEVPYSELGNLIYKPDQHWFGSDSFKWTGHDGTDYSAESTVSLSISSVNDAPTADDESVTKLEDQTHDFTAAHFSKSYSDNYFSENSAFAGIKIVGLETAGYLKVGVSDVILNQALDLTDIADLTFSTDPHENGAAYATFDFTVFDGEDYSTSVYTMTVNVTPVNDIPTFALTADPDVSIDEDHGLYESNNHAISMSEGPPNESSQTLNFDVVNNNNALFSVQPAIDNNGKLTFTTAANKFGTATVTVVLKDNGGTEYGGVNASLPETFTITIKAVNDHPVADNEAVSTNEDITYTFASSDFSRNYSDVESEAMTQIQITEVETVGDLDYNGSDVIKDQVITLTDLDNNLLKFIPNPDEHGASYSSFKFKVYDGTDYSDLEYTMTITVNSVNDEPSFTFKTNANVRVNEDSGTKSVVGQVATQYAGATNETGQTLTLDVSHTNSGLFAVNPAINSAGTLTFTPAPNAHGVSTVTVYITDDGGTENGGDNESDSQQFTITVISINDIPTAANEEVTELEDVTYTFAVSDFSDSYNDVETAFAGIEITSEESTGTLEYNGSPVATGLQIAAADISKLKFIPNADENGNNYDSFGFKVYDGEDYSVSSYTMTIHITPVNDEPTFAFKTPKDVEVDEDSGAATVNGQLINQFEGASNENTQILSIHVSNDNNALFAVQPAIDASGNLSFTPTDDAFGSAVVSVNITDDGGVGDGGDDTSITQTFTITINPVNDPPVAKDDNFETNEDIQLSGNLKSDNHNGIDSDVDSDPANFTYSMVDGGTADTNGTIALNSDGTFTYDADADYFGTVSFTYQVCDDATSPLTQGCDQATVTITVKSVNDTPVAVDDSNTTNEDTAVSGNVLTNDTDLGDAPVSVVSNTNPSNGSVTVNADGTYTYTPNADFFGTDTFEYTIEDVDGEQSTATVTISVNATNDTPVAVDDSNTTNEDTAVNGNVLTNDTDLGDAPVSVVSNTNPSNGSVTVNADGTYTYTPNTDFFGTDTFQYTIEDVDGEQSTATVTITVNATNDTPVAVDDSNTTNEDTAVSGNVLTNDTDLGDAPVSVVSNTNPSNGSVTVNADGTYTYTPNADFFGTDTFEYTIEDVDGEQSTATVTISVNATNDTPVAVDDSNTTNEDTAVNGNVLTNDTDLGDAPVSVVSNTNPSNGSVTVNADGTYTYTPNTDFFGTDTFQYTIEDVDGEQSTATVTITVNATNDTPVAVDDSNTTNEDTAVNGNVLTNDTDLGDAPVTVVSNTNPSNGSVTVNADGTYTYTPNADFFGTDTFEYTIEDVDGEQSTATVTITVNATNDTPVAVDDSNTTNEDTAVNGNVLTNDTDLGDAPVSVVSNTNPSNGSVMVNADGTYTYTPNADFFGTDTFEYTIEDVDGEQSTATVTITVNATNDTPVAVDDSNTTNEDTAVNGNVLTNDTDLGDVPVSVVSNTNPSNGSVTVNADGTYTYTPNTDFFGTDTFQYTIEDVDGEQSTATVTITVNATNDTPVAVDDSNTTNEDTAVNGNVLTNDTDLGDAPVTVVSNTNPSNGSVTVNADGTYTYTPNTDFFGTDTFEYTIEDVDGEQSTATVTITVNATNDTPVAVDDSNTTNEDTAVNGNVLTNDTDLGDAPVSVVSNTNPSNGSVTVNTDGTYTYTPNADFFGTDTFEYTIEDVDGEQSTATVTITVNATNDTPVAVDDSNTTNEDTAVNGNVLTNDTDLGDAPVTVVSNTNPSNGSVTVNADGTYTYTPNADFFGTDTFEYTIEDVDGEQSTATVTITVNATNDTPVAVDDSNTTNEDTAVNGNVLTNDTDLGDAPVSVVSNTNPSNGSVTVNADGTYTYTPNTDFFGTDTFEYTIEDVDGEQSTATVTITVNATNDTPVAVDDSNTTNEDTAVNGNVLTNDTDLGDAPVSVVSNTNPSNGSVTVNADGTYTYTPNTDFFGTDTFEYTIEDVDGEQSTATVTITVNATNDTPVAVDDSNTTNEDTAVNGNVLTNDTDLGDAPVSVVSNTNPSNGSVRVNTDGTYTYTPNADFFGTDTFEYTIEDVDGEQSTATVTITVNATNDTPVAVEDSNTTNEDTAVNGNVLTNDTDLGDAPVSVVSNTNPSNGSVTVNTDGTYTYTPNTDFFGTDTFEYTIEDVDGEQSTATLTITVNATNDTPVAVDDSNTTNEDTAVNGNVLTNDTDLGDAPVSVVSNTNPSNGSVTVNADGTYTYTPNTDFFGTDTFEYTIEDVDGEQSTATLTITVNATNDTPVAVDDSNTTNEDTAVNGNVLTNDTDLGDAPVSVVSNTNPSNGSVRVNTDGTYTYTPNADFFGTDTFEYTIEDVDGEQSTATVTITVNATNDTPVAVDDSNTTNEDTAVNGNVLTNDTDLGDAPVSVVSNTNPSNGSVRVNTDGTYTYTPNADFFGTDTFEYTIEDVDGEQSTATVTIAVNATNDTPVAVDDTNLVEEDASVNGNVLTNDTDLGDAPVTVVSNTNPANGSVTVNADGTYTYTPNADFFGTDTFEYTIEDVDGDQDTAIVTITVNPTDDTPLAVDDSLWLKEDSSISGNVFDNDERLVDVPVIISANTDPSHGTLLINADGTFTYTPNPSYFGNDSFTYTLRDMDGDESTATVSIWVDPLDYDPIANDDSDIINEDETSSGNLFANDEDFINTPVVVVSNTDPANGTVVVNSDGTYTYTPNADFFGTDTFTYTLEDEDGDQDTATVTITVNPVNDTPIAINDNFEIDEDSSESGFLMDNDIHLGDAPVAVVSNTNPANGSVTVNADGTFVYTPNADFFGTDAFEYTIEDVDGEQSTATVTITLNSVNDLPVAVNDVNVTDEDTRVSGNVLTNDTDLGDLPVQVVDMTDPANGMVAMISDGSYTYTPDENFNGIDTFTYTIEDENGDQSTATVSITVNPVNDAPVAIDDTNSTDENTSVSGNVLPNDTDIDLDDLTVVRINGNAADLGSLINLNGGGTIVLNADGSYNFDPNGEFEYLNTGETSQVSFTYVMNDENTDSNTATVVITIVGVNDAPVAIDDFIDTRDNEEIIIIVKDNDSDADGDELGVDIISNPELGDVIVNDDGSITYIADLGAYCQTDQFSYRVCDPEGLCDEATVTIEIGVSDIDEDSIPDAIETLTLNTDGDSDLNYLDLDSDNDGISDKDEAQIFDPCTDEPIDTDGDGIPDYLDSDSDNDGYPDSEEGDDDCDGDGIPDYIDAYDDCGEYVSIPEGFSPNGDGTNDRFIIKGIKDFPNSRLMIFNRWGNKIFEATGYLNDWDGRAESSMKVGSEVIPEGTYYYIIDLGNGEKPIKGFVYINY
ncbi:Ig-like domain-containing protein [Marinifilum sp.]|uniref:Ig-like domain-containing protein n=1 Tax=Marinifilum sp. TaxID=2033137 RepID=UPI003BA92941